MTVLVAVVAWGLTAAAPPVADWSRVRQLRHGTEVIVTVQNGAPRRLYTAATRVVAATDSELIVAPPGRRVSVIRIARTDIESITVRTVKNRGSPLERARGAVLGFLLTAIGAAGGGTGPNFCTDHPHGCLPVSLLGGIVGGVAGYFGGRSETIVEEVLIYRAPRV